MSLIHSKSFERYHPYKKYADIPAFYIGLASFLVLSLILGFIYDTLSWNLLITTSFSGAFAAADFIDALRQRRDFFSPRSLISILMVNAAYVAPVLHIALDTHIRNIALPHDMHNAILNLSLLQLAGFSVYFLILRAPSPFKEKRIVSAVAGGRPDSRKARSVAKWLNVVASFSLAVFLYTVVDAGGPQAWLNTQLNYREELTSSGAVLALAEVFPTLFFMAYLMNLSTQEISRAQRNQRIIIAIFLLLAITFVTSGMRGSRANLVWPALSALIMVNLLFYKIRMRTIVVLAAIGLVFAGTYDIYKKAGTEGVQLLADGSVAEVEEYSGHIFGLDSLILGDFSRTGIQVILLDRWNTNNFDPYLGKTYLGGAMQFVPGLETDDGPPNKRVAATEILYGEGSSLTRSQLSSRIYGLQGEALINFGAVGAVAVLVPFALVVRKSQQWYERVAIGKNEIGAAFVSLAIPVVALLFLSDFDNALANVTSRLLLPLAAVGLARFLDNRIFDSKRNRNVTQ